MYYRKAEEGTVKLEEAEPFEEKTDKVKAKPRLDLAQPVETSATASMKKVDESTEEIKEDKAKKILPVQEPLTVSETQPEERVKDVPEEKKTPKKAKKGKEDKKPEEKVIVSKVTTQILEEAGRSTEVEEIMEMMKVKEFGPAEKPLRELAKIGFMVRQGVSVTEINELYQADKFPALRTPQAQSALVQVVERKGFSPLISEVLTEESTIDETTASTVGFKALMRMVEQNHATVEETLTELAPEDFKPESWITREATEVSST